MKKHTTELAAITDIDLVAKVNELRADISAIKRGVKLGEVQNYQVIQQKKRFLARVNTRLSALRKEAK